jgi:hypothetical protein
VQNSIVAAFAKILADIYGMRLELLETADTSSSSLELVEWQRCETASDPQSWKMSFVVTYV